LTLGPLLLGVSLWVSSYLVSASKGWVDELPGGVTFLLTSLIFVVQTAGFAALFRFVPNTHVRWEHAWSGALFVSVGLELAQKGLALYLAKVPVYSTIYGAFATVPIFLVWLYLSWLIVLQGAVVAAYAPSLLSKVKRWPEVPGHRFQLALAVLSTLVRVQHTPQAGQTSASLSQALRTDPLQVEPILEVLLGLGWVGLLNEPQGENGGRYVLLCDPGQAPLAPLALQTLLEPDEWTQGIWQRSGLAQMRLIDALRA